MANFLIVFPDLNVEIETRLLFDQAPTTCKGFIDAMDNDAIVTTGKHAMYTGKEISVQLSLDENSDNLLYNPAEENLTCFPLPGDLLFTYMPKYSFGGNPRPIFDVGVFYGRDARTFFPMGWLPGNLFAEVKDEQEGKKLAKVGSYIHDHGAQKIVFKRMKEEKN